MAVADVLFGTVSPSGKLPVTFYKNTDNLPAFEDYNMAGRTYRYMTEEALYPFGYGLTYSSVELSDLQVKSYEETATATVTIQNTGNFDTDEVVQVYVKDLESEFAVPNAQLKGFKRVFWVRDLSKRLRLIYVHRTSKCLMSKGITLLIVIVLRFQLVLANQMRDRLR